ncbi:LOW QUALITY PROTEIN: immunoglobulin superfamily DCC subclass member 3-like [Glossophaga mutica]
MGLGLLRLLQERGRAADLELAFVQEPGDVVAVMERPLVLPCQVEGEPPVSIPWQGDGPALANDSGAILMLGGSLHLAALPPTGASLPVPMSLPLFHQHPQSSEGERGGAARSCPIRGVPEPSISWEHNGTALSMANHRVTLLPGGILHTTSVSPQADVGTYHCMARNVADTRHSQDAQLTLSVGFPRLLQEPKILSGPQNLMLTVHQTAVLECIATGHQRPPVSCSRLDDRSASKRPQSLLKPLGSSAISTCVAQGTAEPNPVWLKNGKVLSPGDNVRPIHNSRFWCLTSSPCLSAKVDALTCPFPNYT